MDLSKKIADSLPSSPFGDKLFKMQFNTLIDSGILKAEGQDKDGFPVFKLDHPKAEGWFRVRDPEWVNSIKQILADKQARADAVAKAENEKGETAAKEGA